MNDEFLIEMMEELILAEFKENDYNLFAQQILDLNLSPEELKNALNRILESKSKSLKDKIHLLLRQEKQNLIELAFKRAQKRYKTKMTLRFMAFEQNEMGE